MRPTTTAMNTSYGAASRRGLGTARRAPTARLGTGLTSSSGREAAAGVSIHQAVNVTNRPTTGSLSGMQGLSTSHGNRRNVQDATFFVGVLSQKVSEIKQEIEKLQTEIETHNKDQAQSVSIQQKAERLDKEVRHLEGTLADYNIAMDKMRQGSDASDLEGYIREYEAKNVAFAHDIDRMFMQKQEEESAYQNIERQIEAVYEKNQAKINTMEPDRLQQYQSLMHENMGLQEASSQLQAQIDAVTDQMAMMQAQRDANSYNREYRELEERGIRLQRQMESLVQEHEISQLEPAEMQKRMLEKVKADRARTTALDEHIKQLKDETMKAEHTLEELKADLAERNNGGSSEKDKYEKLYQRDREMTEFIESFEETKSSIVADQKQTQETVVGLLEHISSGLEAEGSMPSQERLKEMTDEASFKERQLESSQATIQRLMKEKEQRSAEMEKIQSLDEKIQMELGSLRTQMESMQQDMAAFDDLDDLRRRAGDTKAYLQEQLASYERRTKSTKEQVTGLRRKYESAKKRLEEHDTYKQLSALEQKLKTYAQNIFTLQEFVETKGRESDYVSLKDNCLSFSGQLNILVKEGLMTQAQNLSEAPLSGTQW